VSEDYQPQKGRRTGGNRVTVPIHPDLAEAIAATPMVGTDAYIVTDYGIASHGLRKLSLTRLAETGCNVFQIAAISGHTRICARCSFTSTPTTARRPELRRWPC
jgi:integrase